MSGRFGLGAALPISPPSLSLSLSFCLSATLILVLFVLVLWGLPGRLDSWKAGQDM